MLETLPDDSFQQVIDACSNGNDGLPLFEAVKGLGCLSKALLQQLHRLQPLVGVRSLAVVQRPAHGPWRGALLHSGALSEAVVEQARQGRVRSIDASKTSLPRTMGPRLALARRVVPELLGAGCSLLELDVSFVKLHVGGNWGCTWASIFGEAAVCSAVLRTLRLNRCGLRGPLPELRLPALQVLDLSGNAFTGGLEPVQHCTALRHLELHGQNKLTGSLEPLRGCTGLTELSLAYNKLTGGLEPLRGCKALQKLYLMGNLLEPTEEDAAHFRQQCAKHAIGEALNWQLV